jgi:hypothetical protein
MTLHRPTPSPASVVSVSPSPADESGAGKPGPGEHSNMDKTIVEELTSRLPTSELIKIIKGALECGKRNKPFTESELLRAMTFGANSTYVRSPMERGKRDKPTPAR